MAFFGGSRNQMNMVEMSPLMMDNAEVAEDGGKPLKVLNHAKYNDLDKILRMSAGGTMQAPRAPASISDGEIYGV